MKALEGGSEKLSKMSSLLERLHAKFNQNRPWSETIKLVHNGHQNVVFFFFLSLNDNFSSLRIQRLCGNTFFSFHGCGYGVSMYSVD
ncbi:hypothetical protein FD754_010969 [Muntiacus muntjak]|uniref:Uncharacterized protein n=1 Tax=Muntiacus muntjak TaxID=9888 RepID=A0A5N3WZH9_MUNMU|nr:hypothetical protein FD754_010969 [Muntiacus muntjak]